MNNILLTKGIFKNLPKKLSTFLLLITNLCRGIINVLRVNMTDLNRLLRETVKTSDV